MISLSACIFVHVLLLAKALATIPQVVTDFKVVDVVQTRVKNWNPDQNSGVPPNVNYTHLIPDGKSWAFRKNLTDPNSPFIIGLTVDFRMQSPDQFIENANQSAGASNSSYNNIYWKQHGNYVTLQASASWAGSITIPPPSAIGSRSTGMCEDGRGGCNASGCYDCNPIWLMNVFRMKETADPSAPDGRMIGFAHNEDYTKNTTGGNHCTWKSVGVRYSDDYGLSWTRSVPILTKRQQLEEKECSTIKPDYVLPGCGDFAAMWNHKENRWQIFMQESMFNGTSPALVMAYSSDTYGRSWVRDNFTTNVLDPAFAISGDAANRTLYHPDLQSIRGANPSIIWDDKNSIWHMVYAKWGGGIAYTNSTGGIRWSIPVMLPNPEFNCAEYPTLIGDHGDTRTSDGCVTIYFKCGKDADDTPIMKSAGLDLSGGTGNCVKVLSNDKKTASNQQALAMEL